ncbi:hypothetical protein [Treponema zioleckii]|nr:hypothetical protein [Treponema zioleckii]
MKKVFSEYDEADKIIKSFLQNKIYDIFEIDFELQRRTNKSLMKKPRDE